MAEHFIRTLWNDSGTDELSLLFCSIETNKSKKKNTESTTESAPFECALNILSGTGSLFFSFNLYLIFFFFFVNVRDDVECEIFMMLPFMSTHSNTFIIYLAVKRFCTAIQFILSTNICYTVTSFPGFKRIRSPGIFLNAIIFKNSKYLVNNILLFKLLCVDVGGDSFIRNEF